MCAYVHVNSVCIVAYRDDLIRTMIKKQCYIIVARAIRVDGIIWTPKWIQGNIIAQPSVTMTKKNRGARDSCMFADVYGGFVERWG